MQISFCNNCGIMGRAKLDAQTRRATWKNDSPVPLIITLLRSDYWPPFTEPPYLDMEWPCRYVIGPGDSLIVDFSF